MTTTISKPNGQSGSYSETQNFCYDEQNQLMWAGNSGTQPAPGNGTCGSGTLANSFPNASYATSFSYTNLGQLWQGPLGGTGSSEQYLYCNSQPHQVSDIVPAGQSYTCSNLPSSIPYAVKYDAWGNVTSRSYNGQTATLSYNKLDEMVEWQVPNTNQAWYAYDANGERTLERSTVGSTTTETVYAFGLEEYSYDSSGTLTSSTHYYSLAGHLIGEVQGSSTNVFLTDALGSVQAVISNTQNSAALLSNQVFAPYGTALSHNGNAMSQYTNKGFTGQYNDPTSGLDYYISRYYDSVAGVFLSADTVAGNPFGMNPYNYVSNNPETLNDPTGEMYIDPGGGGGGSGGSGGGGGGGGGGSGGGNYGGNTYGNINTSPPPPVVRAEEKRVVQEAEQILRWALDHPGKTIAIATEAVDLEVATGGAGFIPAALGALGFVVGIAITVYTLSSNNTASSTPNFGPTPTPGSDIVPPQAANSQIEGHSTVTPTPALTGSSDGGGKEPPTKPTAPPSGDDGFGKLSGNQYHVSEKGIRTIESHLSRSEFIDSFTGNTALEEPENATMLARLWSALAEGQPISGADASFYFHELYENTLMEDGITYPEAHEAAINRYGVSPFSIYHPDAIMANPAAFGPPYFEFWRITP